MNANQIVNMIMRQIVRRLVNSGVNKSFDMAGRMGRKVSQPQSRHREDSPPQRSGDDQR